MSAVDFLKPNKGTDFVRCCVAMAAAKGNMLIARDIAAGRWGSSSIPARICRAAVVGGSLTAGGDWGEELTSFRNAAQEFFDSVAAKAIIGQLVGRRAVPMRTRLISIASGAGASWVAQGASKPISKLEFNDETLDALKVVSLCVVSRELLEHSDVRAESFIRSDMVRALVELLDSSFIDPSFLGVAGESPASITSSGTAVASSDDPNADLANLIAAFEGDLTTAFFVMSGYAGAAASGESNPNVGARGGDIKGIPVITSASAGNTIALIDATAVAISEGEMSARTASSAAIEMDSAPSGSATVPTPTNLVSLFGTNSVALLVEKMVNWKLMRSGVSYIADAEWAIGVSQT